ncbi:type II CAAX prenyl endopeptidase Rce1 family protein [Treponema phagedenis]|nr:CPBP family glutamic-type intramembrane protease [Treponema phagedenis]
MRYQKNTALAQDGKAPYNHTYKMNKQVPHIYILIEFLAVALVLGGLPIFMEKAAAIPPVPTGSYEKLLFALRVFFFALYEEVLYRWYLPERGKLVLKTVNTSLSFGQKVIIECFPLLLFAAAHRYLGIGAVVFAFVMGTMFRMLILAVRKKGFLFFVPCS